MRVLEDLDYSSDNEKIAMHNIVSNWTSVNRIKTLKVYGRVTKVEPGIKKEPSSVNVSRFFSNKFILILVHSHKI